MGPLLPGFSGAPQRYRGEQLRAPFVFDTERFREAGEPFFRITNRSSRTSSIASVSVVDCLG
jgi:hypothetical protein